jgi:hypothetical protein
MLHNPDRIGEDLDEILYSRSGYHFACLLAAVSLVGCLIAVSTLFEGCAGANANVPTQTEEQKFYDDQHRQADCIAAAKTREEADICRARVRAMRDAGAAEGGL